MERFITFSTFSTSTRISVLLALAAFLLLMLPLDTRAKVPLAGQPMLSTTPSSEQLPAAPPLLLDQHQLFEGINRVEREESLRRAGLQQSEEKSVAQAVGSHLALDMIIFGNTKEVGSAIELDLKLLEMSQGESMRHRKEEVLGDFALRQKMKEITHEIDQIAHRYRPLMSSTVAKQKLEDLTAKKTKPGPEGGEKWQPETHDQSAANFCYKCGAKLPAGSIFCPSCGTKVITTPDEYSAPDKYDVAYELYQKRKFDDVISELEAFCADHPNDVKANFLLAKAYLEKSHSLKESGKIGWKPLLSKGYNIGKRFFVAERYNPELIYILGKSLYINNRRGKAVRYGKKAIKLSGYNLEYSEYFLLVGDAYSSLAGPFDSSVTSTPAQNYATLAVKYYNYVINGFKGAKADDSSRALAYYRLAVHHSESSRKRKAKESLEAALQLSPEESLSSQIHALLNKL